MGWVLGWVWRRGRRGRGGACWGRRGSRHSTGCCRERSLCSARGFCDSAGRRFCVGRASSTRGERKDPGEACNKTCPGGRARETGRFCEGRGRIGAGGRGRGILPG